MYRQELFNRLDFQNDIVLDEQIEPVRAIQMHTFVFDRQMNLPLKPKAQAAKFIAEALFICRFQQPRPEMSVNLNRCSDYLFSNVVFSVQTLCTLCLCGEQKAS